MKLLEFALSTVITTSGISPAATFVSKTTRESRSHVQKPFTLGARIQDTRGELFDVYQERSKTNWDGYGGAPVTEKVYLQALRVLEALPLGKVQPTVGAEPDGQITLEWYRGPYRTLSVSVTGDGDLHYAALIGTSKAFGTEAFLGEIPTLIAGLLDRVCVA